MEPLDFYREFWIWKLRISITRDRNAGTGIEFMWSPYDPFNDLRRSGGLCER